MEQHGLIDIQAAFEQKGFILEYLQAACRNARHQSAVGTAGHQCVIYTLPKLQPVPQRSFPIVASVSDLLPVTMAHILQ